VETLSIQDVLERIDADESFAVLYMKTDASIRTTMPDACARVADAQTAVEIYRVDIDPETLTPEEARRLRVARVPQLHFYLRGALLGVMTGRTSPSEIHQKVLALYAS
jgi:hypothetical protein